MLQHSLRLACVCVCIALTGCVSNSYTPEGSEDTEVIYDETQKSTNEERAKVRLDLGLRYLQKGMIENAKKNLEKAMSWKSDLPDVHLGMAHYYKMVGDIDRTYDSFETALKLDDNNPDTLNNYAAFLCEQGRFKQSEEYFNKALKVRSYANVGQTYQNLGVCIAESGDVPRAESYYRKALSYDKKLPDALLGMAEAQLSKQEYVMAKSYLQRYREVARHSARSLWIGIRIEHALGDRDQVKSYALLLQQAFPDAIETGLYQDAKHSWLK